MNPATLRLLDQADVDQCDHVLVNALHVAPEGTSVTVLGNRSLDPEERRIKAVRITVGGRAYDMYPERIPVGAAPAE